jgi:plasmid maintenance system antidote protein VapI
MIPKYRLPVHPGEVLLEEFIIPKKLSQIDLAIAQQRLALN